MFRLDLKSCHHCQNVWLIWKSLGSVTWKNSITVFVQTTRLVLQCQFLTTTERACCVISVTVPWMFLIRYFKLNLKPLQKEIKTV